ncbi:hypothetical protein Tco_1386044 [Tanacetum coccineum]
MKNKVIKEPKSGLFFIDVFGDEAFQKVSDVQKVETETLLRYKMVAFNDKSATNQRFMALIDKMIYEQHEKDKRITKKVKLELIGFNDVYVKEQGGGANKGILGSMVGKFGMVGIEGNGGKETLGILGIVRMVGNVGSVGICGCGSVGIMGICGCGSVRICGYSNMRIVGIVVVILVTECTGRNLTEGVDWAAERLNAISERLSKRLHEGLFQMFCKSLVVLSYIVENLGTCKGSRTKGTAKASGSLGASGSCVKRLSLSICTDLSAKAFSHVNFDEYIRVALSEGLLIAGKEYMVFIENLYGWVVGFDEVLVVESNTTKINSLKRWFSFEKNSAVSELSEASTCILKELRKVVELERMKMSILNSRCSS